MEAALDEMEAASDLPADRHWSSTALAGLIPAPEPDLADVDPDTSIEQARKTWPAPDTFTELIKRWLPIARGQPKAADALIKLAWCASPAWQATTGLQWVEELIGGSFAAVAGRCYYLTRWLGDIRPILPGEVNAARWRRVVDGLAAAGDNRAARLQQAEELPATHVGCGRCRKADTQSPVTEQLASGRLSPLSRRGGMSRSFRSSIPCDPTPGRPRAESTRPSGRRIRSIPTSTTP